LFMSTVPLTKRGAALLRDELQRLKSVERPAVVNSIAEARAQGDLSENAEYDAARRSRALSRAALPRSSRSWPARKLSTRRPWRPTGA